MNPLNTIKGTIATGVVLAILIGVLSMGVSLNEISLLVWLHVLGGIVWIGILYYFNFVQVPALAAAAADQGGPGGAGISKYVAPRALLWFRWGAVFTWVTGAILLMRMNLFVDAFTLGLRETARRKRFSDRRRRLARHDHAAQRLGADLAESEKGARARRSYRRGNRKSAPRGLPRVANEHRTLDTDADEHGRLRSRRVFRLIVPTATPKTRERPILSGSSAFSGAPWTSPRCLRTSSTSSRERSPRTWDRAISPRL